MWAVITGRDDAKTLAWKEVPTPSPGQEEIRIRVEATAVNRADLLQRSGHYPPPSGITSILGLEVSGTVDQIGADSNRFQLGDRVCALLSGGGYAQYVVCPESHVLPIPTPLSTQQGAAIPEVFATAHSNLFSLARLGPHEQVLIHAGASGVGTAAIQLCRAFGHPCFVTTSTTQKVEACIQLGAAAGGIRTESWADSVASWAPKGVNVILDPVGGGYLPSNLKVLGIGGRIIIIGLMGGRHASLDLGRLLVKRQQILGSVLRSRTIAEKAQIMTQLEKHVWPLFATETIHPVIHAVFPIEHVEEAHQVITSNRSIGKVLLTIPH